jgi:thioredoxin 1
VDEYQQDLPDEDDDDVCPVECVREFKTDEEFGRILDKSKGTGTLVVVDFYRTSCGSCRYIEQGFAKLCRKSGSHDAPVIFLKHNVSACMLSVLLQLLYHCFKLEVLFD